MEKCAPQYVCFSNRFLLLFHWGGPRHVYLIKIECCKVNLMQFIIKGAGAAFSLTAAGERITLAGMLSKFFP